MPVSVQDVALCVTRRGRLRALRAVKHWMLHWVWLFSLVGHTKEK